MGDALGKLANMQWEKRLKNKQVRELRYNPQIRSADFVKRSLMLSLLALVFLKFLNAKAETRLQDEYKNLHFSQNLGQPKNQQNVT